jgi:hypothetical protein
MRAFACQMRDLEDEFQTDLGRFPEEPWRWVSLVWDELLEHG